METYRNLEIYKNEIRPENDIISKELLAKLNDDGSNRSHWLLEVTRADGTKWASAWTKNLTTDTATTYQNRRDWQSKAMGGYGAPVANMVGIATSVNSSSLGMTTGAFPVAGQGLAGAILVASANSTGGGTTVFGVINSTSNSILLVVDQWYNPGTFAAGSTPAANANFCVLPGQMPAMWLALTANTTAPTSADITLRQELATNGFTRALGAWSHTQAASTYVLAFTYTCSGGSTSLNVYGNAGSAVSNVGVLPFTSAIASPPTLITSDTVALTCTITIN